jgi:hypothetical protein
MLLRLCQFFYLIAALGILSAPACAQNSVRHQILLEKAQSGDSDAQYALGLGYASGFGVEENPAEAIKWYRAAAEQGMAVAQKNLAEFLANGRGEKRNYVEAYKWYEISIPNLANAFVRSLHRLERDKIEKKMTPDEVNKAKELAALWVKKFEKRDRANSGSSPAAKIDNKVNATAVRPDSKKTNKTVIGNEAQQTTYDDEARFKRILLVGPQRHLKTPSAAAKLARSGDLIKIDAGEYENCAIWRTKNITIRGIGGYAHVRDKSCDGKAIWVFYDSPVTVQNIRFSGSRVRHRNGAGIRWEGNGRLVVRDSWFHNNQMGILTHNVKRSELIVEKSKFESNGDCYDFCGHGVYAGRIYKLVVSNSEFTNHRWGHHIKSRAYFSNIIGNKISDGSSGTASFAINLPDSGTASIRYNYMEKGPRSDNVKAMISIGEEGQQKGKFMNPSRGIVIEGNSFQNNNRRGTFFVWNRGWHPVSMRSNRFTGKGHRYTGFGR